MSESDTTDSSGVFDVGGVFRGLDLGRLWVDDFTDAFMVPRKLAIMRKPEREPEPERCKPEPEPVPTQHRRRMRL